MEREIWVFETRFSIIVSVIYSLYVWGLGVIVTLFLGGATLFLSLFAKSQTIHKISGLWARLICKISGVRVEIKGKENINPRGPQIFLANHQGFFDIFAIAGFFNVPFIWFAKKGLFFIPLVGSAMSKAGYISVDRSKPLSSARSLKTAVRRLRSGMSIVIFPEGTRTVDGSVSKFKKGSLFLAIKSRVPIVPVTIAGSYEVLKKGSMLIRPGKIIIQLGPPISTESLTKTGEVELLENIYETIETSLLGLNKSFAPTVEGSDV
ncbi:MAG: lysophospholipid acyltransferase family protein [Nitrospinota bacterium]